MPFEWTTRDGWRVVIEDGTAVQEPGPALVLSARVAPGGPGPERRVRVSVDLSAVAALAYRADTNRGGRATSGPVTAKVPR